MKSDFPLLSFAIALFIGALIGLDREKHKAETGAPGIGGIRTFILFAMSGAIAAWLAVKFAMPWIFLTASLCVTIIVMTGYAAYAIRHEEAHGLTTEIAAFVTFLLGGTALFGQETLAVALGIAASAILAYKQPIHRAIGFFSEDDIHAILKLLVATFIVLPVLPDRTIDPWDALNPYKMWWIVVLISGLSFVGYVASRFLGEQRALPLTGLVGGIVSSTVVSLAFAKRSRESVSPAGDADALASGLLLAWFVMFVRILIIVAVFNSAMLRPLIPSMVVMGSLTVILGLFFYRRSERSVNKIADNGGQGSVQLQNPFSLTSAIKFALFFAVVLLVVKVVQLHLKGHGLYLVAALAGLTDVDAITLSMSDYGRVSQQAAVAVMAVVIAAVTNTLVKCGFVAVLGGRALKLPIFISTAIILAAGAFVLFLQNVVSW